MLLRAVCFGEVLWDVFPNHKKIGGAPLNVALRLQSFGVDTTMISSVGNDKNGREIQVYLNKSNLVSSSIQENSLFKTGVVTVELDDAGSATYEIDYPTAWDNIHLLERDIKIIKKSDVLIYGSLSCRNEVSKNALTILQEYSGFNVFDVNLRAPHYNKTVLQSLLKKADFIKFNNDELLEICHLFSLNTNSLEEQVKAMAQYSKVSKICVTQGEKGAVLFIENKFYYNSGIPTEVIDTVGAGDSFLASLVFKLLSKESYQKSLDFACAVGSYVAGCEGANPEIDYSLFK